MISQLQLTLFLNGYSPILLKAAYYMSQSVYLMIVATAILSMKKSGLKSGIYATASIGLIYAVSYALKLVFNEARPGDSRLILIEKDTDPSFPSGHASSSFGAAAISGKRIFYVWALLISISRLILGVHYLGDIIAGAFIGYILGRAATMYEKTIFDTFFSKEHVFETRRKIVHGLVGIVVSAFVFLAPRTFAIYFGIALIIFLSAASAIIRGGFYMPLLSEILAIFERKKDMQEFPLKGTIYFLIGSFAALLLYEKTIASAAIIILALGDSISTLVGKPFGKTKHFHNIKKSAEGSISGFAAAFIGAIFLVSPKVALVGALSGMVVESFDSPLDDNITIPIICGAVMSFFSS